MRFPAAISIPAFIIILFCAAPVWAQNPNNGPNLRDQALKVYIDCNRCDIDFIRREIPYVNYVRDRIEAQVHLLITKQSTGSGGTEYRMNFIGLKEFEGVDEETIYISTPDETSDKTRRGYTRMISFGLMKYVATTPLVDGLTLQYNDSLGKISESQVVEDKWRSWVFDVRVIGQLDEQESYSSLSSESDLGARKITPGWKIDFGASYDQSDNKYRYDGEEYLSSKTSFSVRNLTVKSLNDHWSLGARAGIYSSTYGNTRFSASVAPAIEYNYFPYFESNRKQIRFQYRAGYGYVFYQDSTIYNKLEEGLFSEQLSVAADFRQPWGSINLSIQGSNYLHDFSKNSLRMWAGFYFRIFKGLSLSISGDAAIIHDQLSLTKDGATEEEILLKQKQIASQYDYSLKIGFSYTFGSIYNNVVNPRFNERY
jgi:hypothetical protein